MNNMNKKDSRGISCFPYIFGNHWDSNRSIYLILTETLTIITLLSIYRFVVFQYPFETYSYILPYFW